MSYVKPGIAAEHETLLDLNHPPPTKEREREKERKKESKRVERGEARH